MKTTFNTTDAASIKNLKKRISKQISDKTNPGEDFFAGLVVVAREYDVSLIVAQKMADYGRESGCFSKCKSKYLSSYAHGLWAAVILDAGLDPYHFQ